MELSDKPAASLEEFAKLQLKPAQTLILMRRELVPMMVFESPTGTGIAAVPDYGEDTVKGPAREALRAMLKEKGATRYAFIIEAWMSTAKGSEISPGMRPRDDPKRKEAIVVSAADNKGCKILCISFITRAPKISFSEPELCDAGFGATLDLLTKPTVN
jgi:hypothetical protein